MDDDMYTHELSVFFSTIELVTGCIFKMEGNSFSWIYEIELNKKYKKFSGLMNFLLDCSLEDVNDEIFIFNYTNEHLLHKFSSVIEWATFKETRANAELVSLAKALNGEKILHCSGLRVPTKLKFLIQQLRTH